MMDFIMRSLKNKTVLSLLSIVFGVYLIVKQSDGVTSLLKAMGYLILAAAIIGLIIWFLSNKYDRTDVSLILALLGIIVGVMFVFTPRWLINFYPVVMGLILIINSITNIASLRQIVTYDSYYKTSMAMSIISLIFGIVVLTHPTAVANVLIVIMGITYLINGIADLSVIHIFKNLENNNDTRK